MLARWGIRIVASLVGIAAGIVLSVALLSDFSTDTTGIVEATIVFWIVHIIVNFFALQVLIRQPSVAMAGLLALASTIVSLIIVNLIVSDISIGGATTYLGATLIIWITTAVADMLGGRRSATAAATRTQPDAPRAVGRTPVPEPLIDRSVNRYPSAHGA